MRKLLCRLGLFHNWQPLSGLAPAGYQNYRCSVCGSRRYRPVNWKSVSKSKNLKGGNHE